MQELLQFEFPSLALYEMDTYRQMYEKEQAERDEAKKAQKELDAQIEALREQKRKIKREAKLL